MTEVERAEVLLNDAEKRVAKARTALRDARIAEATGGRLPVAGGFRDFFFHGRDADCTACGRESLECSLNPCFAVLADRNKVILATRSRLRKLW